MSHIHIPDGVLPLWLVLAGWILAVGFLALATWRLGRAQSGRRLALLGVMAAVMLVGMSVEIVPIAYHINLSVLAGIVLAPALSFLAAFIVNLMLALFGHGGITVVGLNSLVLGAEMVLGYYLFHGAWLLMRRRGGSPARAAAVATPLALLLSTLLMLGIVGISNLDPGARIGSALEEISFRNPLEHGLIAVESPGEEEAHAEGSAPEAGELDVVAFARMVILLGFLGWLLETALTVAILGSVYRMRPDLVEGKVRRATVATRGPRDPRSGQLGGGQPPARRAG